ncbi:MAG: AlpA family phage regulatory protein [Henriciella sp.]|jgi:predicted DNA-binding transcriptional regulator AlpA
MPEQPALPETGLLRLRQIIHPNGPIPVGKSTWWAGVKDGRFPQPLKLGAGVTVWRVKDIRELIENGAP